ncbi:hypothetical protein Tco_1290851, partial [Tanacetum coccineum]
VAHHLQNLLRLASFGIDDEEKFSEETGMFSGRDPIGDDNLAGIDHLDELSSIVMTEPYSRAPAAGTCALVISLMGKSD